MSPDTDFFQLGYDIFIDQVHYKKSLRYEFSCKWYIEEAAWGDTCSKAGEQIGSVKN